MQQSTGRGCLEATGEVTVPSRRVFLGISAGCAIPFVAGVPFFRTAGLLGTTRAGVETDPVWEHLSTEAQRLLDEVQSPHGPRGEHVRRLASQVGLFAAHLRGLGLDAVLDDEARRMVRERGKDGVAWEVIEYHRSESARARRPRRRGTERELDSVTVAASVGELDARGTVKVMQSWRPRLERLAALMDREATAVSGHLRGVSAAVQKPGDDFQGLPELPMSREEACKLLSGTIAACNVMIAFLAVSGCEPVAGALGVIEAILAGVEQLTCWQILD